MTGCIALVVAAGRGSRLGGEVPKQYRNLGGRPMLRYSLQAFLEHPQVDAVRAVIDPEDRPHYDAATRGLDLLPPVPGGETRQDSVRLGLESLAEIGPARVLIHDAVRPFVDPPIISRIIAALDGKPGAIAAVPVTDTLKRAVDDNIAETVDRKELWRAQTPQGFRYPEILAAHRAATGAGLTDDAAVAERAGLEVTLVMAGEDNFKITTEADLERAQRLIGETTTEVRVGMGFDAHRFAADQAKGEVHVMLCGVAVAHDRQLLGHSDADVGLHALTDAILGAIGQGDIGSHFPASDPEWRGAASETFLRHAARMVAERRGEILHLDLTLICEAPEVRPHHAAMVAQIAQILSLSENRISVKATTTDRLGFTGRGEGIAAQAAATLRLPR